MRKTRIVGLALLAVFALSAVVTSEASAKVKTEWKAPQWGKCTKVGAKKGLYGAATCGTKVAGETGEWEWEPSRVNLPFTSATGKAALKSENAKGEKKEEVTCTASTDKGEVVGTTEANETTVGEGAKKDVDTISFTSCTLVGVKCNSAKPPAKEGEIITAALETKLVKSGIEVFDIFQAPGEGTIASFKCGAVSFVVTGKVAGVITPLDKMTNTLKLKFAKGFGLQELKLEINGSKVTGTVTQEAEGTITLAEKKELEIKSVGT
jgi:hypothetical protein